MAPATAIIITTALRRKIVLWEAIEIILIVRIKLGLLILLIFLSELPFFKYSFSQKGWVISTTWRPYSAKFFDNQDLAKLLAPLHQSVWDDNDRLNLSLPDSGL